MSRARRLAGLAQPKDDIVTVSNNNSPYLSKLVQTVKKIMVPIPKELKSSKKSRISFTPKVSLLVKKKNVMRSQQEVDYESNRNMKEKETNNDNSLSINGINEISKTISQNQNFQVPITPASK
jgi:hypothetical protein